MTARRTLGCALALLLATTAHADPLPHGALVLVDDLPPATVARVRAELGDKLTLSEDPLTRGVLEGFATPTPLGDRVAEALGKVHQHMRQFELAYLRASIEEAWSLAQLMPPNAASRVLVAEVWVRDAALALLERDAARQLRSMRLALSAHPQLRLDPAQEAPPLLALLEKARTQMQTAPRCNVHVAAPPGGEVAITALGVTRGVAPLELTGLPAGPLLLWATRAGDRPSVKIIDAREGLEVTVELSRLPADQRLRPLVDSVRQSLGAAREASALALASALEVDVIVVAGARGEPTFYARKAATPNAPSRARNGKRPWYRKGWTWGVIAGAVVVSAGAVTLGVLLSRSGPQVDATCCR